MVDVFIYIVAFLITVPPVLALIVYMVSYKRSSSSLWAVHRTANWSTLFFLIAVDLLLSLTFDLTMTGGIIIFLLVLLSFIIFIQWKTAEIQIRKAVRLLWRSAFLIFSLLYFLLLTIGVFKQMTL